MITISVFGILIAFVKCSGLERFSIKWRKIKTKVITHDKNKRNKKKKKEMNSWNRSLSQIRVAGTKSRKMSASKSRFKPLA